MSAPLLQVNNISKSYTQRAGWLQRPREVRAVAGVGFHIMAGETLGLVGESGSGKSTTGRLALGLESADSGTVAFDGQALPDESSLAWRQMRADMQMIFQDPLGALDRRLAIADQIIEPLDIHQRGSRAERLERVAGLLRAVGLSGEHGRRLPSELSGGQRQRAVLARALATAPRFLVCDEPVSALDVSIQAQIVNLLSDLQGELGLTLLFISHDLRVVRQISHRVAVMYLGRIVETGPADTLFANARHPYTQALVSASPAPGKRSTNRIILSGDPPNPAARPSGCALHPRCARAIAVCSQIEPRLSKAEAHHEIACHLVETSPQAVAA